jgi:hypothetical protein
MALLPLTNGQTALVDDADLTTLSAYRWTVSGDGYPYRNAGKGRRRYLAHDVLPPRDGLMVDHADGDRLNAMRSNLRHASNSQNQANRQKVLTATGYKGVTVHRQTGRYQAQIKHNGRNVYLGLFKDPVVAARAYWRMAGSLFGSFRWTNLPEDQRMATWPRYSPTDSVPVVCIVPGTPLPHAEQDALQERLEQMREHPLERRPCIGGPFDGEARGFIHPAVCGAVVEFDDGTQRGGFAAPGRLHLSEGRLLGLYTFDRTKGLYDWCPVEALEMPSAKAA